VFELSIRFNNDENWLRRSPIALPALGIGGCIKIYQKCYHCAPSHPELPKFMLWPAAQGISNGPKRNFAQANQVRPKLLNS